MRPRSIDTVIHTKSICTVLLLFPAIGWTTEDYSTVLGQDPHAVFSKDQFVDEWLVDVSEHAVDNHWSMSLVKEKSGYLIVASYNVAGQSDSPKWVTKSTKQIRLLRKDETVAAGTCELGGDPKPNIVAIVKDEPDKELFTDVRYAVSFDEARAQFTEIKTVNLRCINEGYLEGD